MRIVLTAMVSIVIATCSVQAKIGDDLEKELKKVFIPNKTYAVVMKSDLPTTSVYGIQGDQTEAYYGIDIKEGEWSNSEGFWDFNQMVVDHFNVGEVLELKYSYIRPNRLDLHMVSLEQHKVTRNDGLFNSEQREPVATLFKFFMPYPKEEEIPAEKLPEIVAAVEAYIKLFKNEDAARAFSAKMVAGDTGSSGESRPRPIDSAAPKSDSQTESATKKEIKAGMTQDEVKSILGEPTEELTFESTVRWKYSDMTIIFENGKVTELKF